MKEKCKDCGCLGIRARGFCWKCYETKRLNGEFKQKSLCKHCGLKHAKYKGLCTKCYSYYTKYGKLERNMYISTKDIYECGHCGKVASKYVRGLCLSCYRYEQRHGSLEDKVV